MSIATIILAAGQGTRMRSNLPKVLHPLAGAPLVIHSLQSAAHLGAAKTIVVTGHGADAVTDVTKSYDPTCECVLQSKQLGTGHAVDQARDILAGFPGHVLVLYGDTPLIRPETLKNLLAKLDQAAVAVLGFQTDNPGRYGRLVMRGDQLDKIIEFKDATTQEQKITLCNSGVMAAPAALLFELLSGLNNDNASGEYYLTDVVGAARARGLTCAAVVCDVTETLGVNSRVELAQAEAVFQARARHSALENGVTLQAPETVYFAHDTVIGRDTVIEPHVVFGPGVQVQGGAHIRAFSHLEGCDVATGVCVGPYARLRPGTILEDKARIGNFVELKAARVGSGAKINHLTYIGDADIGARSNIGAGTVTCNYDGMSKHKTTIGQEAFIGSDTMLVAPVTVGDQAMTASGSVITRDVPAGDLALGRAVQVNKPGLARKFIK